MANYIGGLGIQWNGSITSPQELASVIQGESATPEGQFGVASVMYNRLQNGGFGSSLSQVVTPNNFNGYNVTPSANAQSLANDIWNGNAPSGGNPGNALFFANPNGVSNPNSWASWSSPFGQAASSGAAPNLGGNFFTDTQGAPSANFQAPSYGGASPASNYSDGASQSDAFDNNSGMFDNGSQVGAVAGGAPTGLSTTGTGDFYNLGATSAPGSSGVGNSVSVSGNQAPFSDDITNFSVAGVNAPPASGVSTAAAPQGTAPTATGGSGSNAGAPLDITNAQQVGDQAAGTIASGATTAANTLSKSVTGAGQAVQSSVANFAAAGTSWLGSIFSAGTSLFVRGGFVALGLVLIIGAFVFFYAENRQGGGAIA